MTITKYVYYFGPNGTEGDASMKNTLGGKGANLAQMAKIGLPVPAGFTIITDFCNTYIEKGRSFPESLKQEVTEAIAKVEKEMGMKFGDPQNPLLLSCRSGARRSMPGMMETVLNVGTCSHTIPGLIKMTNNPHFVWDAYRRLIMMYSDVVMEKAEDIQPRDGKGIRHQLESILEELKKKRGYQFDSDISADELAGLCETFKRKIKENFGREFPDDPYAQLWGSIGAVFKSWGGRRAVAYRLIEGIPHNWGTACNVQSMVFGNKGDTSATGVAFSRNPATGENKFYGEWLPNAQGEDVVAGIRTPNPINDETKSEHNSTLPSLEAEMPEIYKQLFQIRMTLESQFKDMQDIEFTIQEKKLYMLQCRNGKRTGVAALNIALDMLHEGLIDEKTCITRVEPQQLDELLHPIVDPAAERKSKVILAGLPAGPGGACGKIVFSAADAVKWTKRGEKVILVREETNPEDIEGMRAAVALLTARGGMTSHAALVARGWGKCCIVGAARLEINLESKTLNADGLWLKEGDVLTLNGTRGRVYQGALNMVEATENPRFREFMLLVDKFRKMKVRTNADTPEDARIALEFGAEGIGLFRTEHMFYGKHSSEPLFLLRKMILSHTDAERNKAISDLFPYFKRDIKNTLEAMDGLPVTIRLLDPPLHEFIPKGRAKQTELAKALGISTEDVKKRGEALHESNPMLGHRGVRLGITYPEITEMQVRAIFEASAELIKAGKRAQPEIMVPVTCAVSEINITKKVVDRVHEDIETKFGVKIEYKYGTMIEIPRACLLADQLAETAEFFSFGTNDLTQMTFGFSRDDVGGFLGEYIKQNILEEDPFQTIDQKGVGQFIEMSVERGRKTRKDLKIGICGEQGGDPASVFFCLKSGLDYVSCSPYRVPIAKLAAAQASLEARS